MEIGRNWLPVEIIFDAYPDVTYTGTVTAIDPTIATSNNVKHDYSLCKNR
jgi:multidrug resistance efflux pump